MLKSYEAVYNNGQIRWLGQTPPLQKEMRMLVVVEVIPSSWASPETTITEIPTSSTTDFDLKKLWQEWQSQNDGKKPQGGRLRPKLQSKTAAQCVLEDRE
jgi:hypothetical protein